MPSEGLQTPLPPSLFARLALAARYAITGVWPESWFGPQQPLQPQAPPEVKGRQWDYPFGVNLSYVPRSKAASRSPSCARSPTRCRCCAPSSKPARTRSPA